jgi:predicted ATP-grasp superfamily ATP-dependent carboligase
VLFPTDDAGAIFLAEHGDGLRDRFLFTEPPRALPRLLAGKMSLYELCQRMGLPSPHARQVTCWSEAAEFARDVGLPLVGKLSTPWRSAGLRSTTIVRDRAALADLEGACRERDVALVLQEYIPWAPGQDWIFHGYCDAAARCAPAFTGVKERSYPPHAGLTTLGRSVDNPALREQLVELIYRLGFHGIVDLDLRQDPRDGAYKLLDFNPRLGAQFRLFRDTAGVDVVHAQHLELTGNEVPNRPQVENRRFLVENYDTLAAIGYRRRGELGLLDWMRSLRGVDETAWFARDDLRPFGLMCLRVAWRALTRRLPTQPPGWNGNPPRFRPGRAGTRPRAPAPDPPFYRPPRSPGHRRSAGSTGPPRLSSVPSPKAGDLRK